MDLLNLLFSVRAKIREGHPEYPVTAHSWPNFLYAGFQAHVDDMERGLLQSELLVMVGYFPFRMCQCIRNQPMIDRLTSTYSRHRPP
jgi:hypothetical protein